MIKILELDYKTVDSKSTETYIDFKLVFNVEETHDYYGCFKKLTEDKVSPKLVLLFSGDFLYHSYLENCNTVLGVIKDLQELQFKVKPKSFFDDEARLLRCIKALIVFWH